ncbi:MAG TPA: carboxypeptidase regulatory-like domain-containing protein [Polyangiaceae bacterium]|nr:carboxypeptidase regulatory-like domain-containing protein [Polyangiaceae bacterium]
MNARRVLDTATLISAALACVLLLLGLHDTPRRELEIATAPLPASAGKRDASLALEVTTNAGGALGNASIAVFWEQNGTEYPVGAALTDLSGRASMRELPHGFGWVLVESAGFARVSRAVALEAGETKLHVELSREASESVRVTDERGAAIAGATVLVHTSDPLPFGALTDAKGTAVLGRLQGAPWTVTASARGYESAERAGVNGPVTLVLRRLSSISILVTRAGAPAAGATVAIAGSSLWPARRTLTGADGRCRIAGLLAGAYDLVATQGSDVSEPLVGYGLERGSDAEVTLVLEPGHFVNVTVTDGDGESPALVPDAEVVLAPGGVGSFPLLGRTGSNGKVTLGPVGRGMASVGARADGFVSSALVALPADKRDVTLPLLRGATLHGDVVDGRGFPIGGASIDVVGTDAFGLPVSDSPLAAAFRATHFDYALAGPAPLVPAGELGVMPGPVPPIPAPGTHVTPGADLWTLAQAPPPAVEAWITNPSGSFTARPVTPGRVRAVARHPDYVEGSSASVVLTPGGEAHVKIVLLAGGTVFGRVLDDRSFPVEGAEVELASSRTSFTRSTLTARDGAFELTGIPADVTVSVRRAGGERRVALRRELKVPEDERTELDLVLPAPREAVRFQVTNGDDAPVELASVTVLSIDPDAPLRETLFTDAEGTAEIADARGLALRVVVEAAGYPRKVTVVEHAPELVRVTLEAGVLVEGEITAVRGRKDVAGALVTLVTGGARRVSRTDSEGRYRFADVAIGAVHLAVNHPDYARAELDATVAATGRADRAFELPPIDLSEPGGVEGDVVDADGNPVAGARVAVGSAPAFLPAGALPPGVTQTDSSGHFVLDGIAEGHATLEAVSALSGRGHTTVDVRAGRVADRVRIVLAAKASEEMPEGGNVAVTLGERGTGSALEVVVASVAPSSEAERAGVAVGDVLVGVDGARPTSMSDARRRLTGRPGSDVVLELVRGGTREVLRVARETVRE